VGTWDALQEAALHVHLTCSGGLTKFYSCHDFHFGISQASLFLPWLIRRIECVCGSLPGGVQRKALFKSDELSLDLLYTFECSQNATEDVHAPEVDLKLLDLSTKGTGHITILSYSKGAGHDLRAR
jgi:hypothetical protein